MAGLNSSTGDQVSEDDRAGWWHREIPSHAVLSKTVI